jgi:hypothetical protein
MQEPPAEAAARRWCSRFLSLVAPAFCSVLAATEACAQQQDREIIRRGEGRVDFRTYYQEDDPDGAHQWKWVLRYQRPWLLPGDWKLSWRFDLPLLYTNAVGPANRNGDYDIGIGDVLGQFAFTTPDIVPDLNVNFGFRLVAPTGGRRPFGSSQWKAAPQLGLSYELTLAPGYTLEFAPLVRYFHGFGTTRSGVTTTREYDVYPTITLGLPGDWAIALWDENPPTYGGRANAWFVPFDIIVTKKVSPRFSFGLGAAVRLIDDYPKYKYMIYGRASIYL